MIRAEPRERISTGIRGLDEILAGGLPRGRSCVVRGGPGTGKTAIGAHFLEVGVRLGESVLAITLGENKASLIANAAQMGIDLTGVDFLDFSPTPDHFETNDFSALFSPADVERDEITRLIIEKMNSSQPRRVFLDSSSHLRLLAVNTLQFRTQLLSLIRYLLGRNTTLLLTAEASTEFPDHETSHLCDGVIALSIEQDWRYVEVTKLRGSNFRPGRHTFRLGNTGGVVFPVLRPQDHAVAFEPEIQRSGILGIDRMLCGGLERGTTTIITGPAGTGKTTLALHFAIAAARQKKRAVMFTFEESHGAVALRAAALGYPNDPFEDNENFCIKSIEPLFVSTDEVASMVRDEVEKRGCSVFILDSISGFRLSVKHYDFIYDLRSLLKYLKNMGVTVIVLNEVTTLTGVFRPTELGVSFLGDNVIFLRYLELRGEMRKSIGVLKKRHSDFERCLREMSIGSDGIKVGDPLIGLRGLLNGMPEWVQEAPILPGPQLLSK